MKNQHNLSYDLLQGKELYFNNKNPSNCLKCFCLFLTLLTWAFISIIIYVIIHQRKELYFIIIFGIITYINLICFEFRSMKIYIIFYQYRIMILMI